jgi:hypothetical protein
MIQDATFIHPEAGHAKADKPRGDRQKQEGVKLELGQRREESLTLDISSIDNRQEL